MPKGPWAHTGCSENTISQLCLYLNNLETHGQFNHYKNDCPEVFWNNQKSLEMFLVLKSTVFLINTRNNAKKMFRFKRLTWVTLVREFPLKPHSDM
jgi:hypothetical protein